MSLAILIVGGYGMFGGRLVDLLDDDPRLTLIIAGRSFEKARDFCHRRLKAKAQLRYTRFDRAGDVEAALEDLKPNLVVDCSGPFQAYGEHAYKLVEACIAHGVDYLDLADASDFVAGIAQFDAAAKAKNVFVLCGASTTPALTAAAVRALATDMAHIDTIRAGIAPSPYARVGENVIRAIAFYAGKPIMLRRDGKDAIAHPFTEQMRLTIAPPGRVPLNNRLFSLVDVPDLRALPALWPEVREVWMGAGPVPEALHRALVALAALVRVKILPSLTSFTPLMHAVTNLLRWGEHRGAMFVAIEGRDANGAKLARSWHLLAEGDDGPLIPSMATASVVRKLLRGERQASGARAAARDFELADYAEIFTGRTIVTGFRNDLPSDAPLYQNILDTAWNDLPPQIRTVHSAPSASGRAKITRGHFLAGLIADVIGFPNAGDDVPLNVRFDPRDGGETWTRSFGAKSFSSHQSAGANRWDKLICERFGPITFAMAPVLDGDKLRLVVRAWRIFGIGLPLWLAPRADAYESVENERFHFHVDIRHPLIGRIIRYEGWLEPDKTPVKK